LSSAGVEDQSLVIAIAARSVPAAFEMEQAVQRARDLIK